MLGKRNAVYILEYFSFNIFGTFLWLMVQTESHFLAIFITNGGHLKTFLHVLTSATPTQGSIGLISLPNLLFAFATKLEACHNFESHWKVAPVHQQHTQVRYARF